MQFRDACQSLLKRFCEGERSSFDRNGSFDGRYLPETMSYVAQPHDCLCLNVTVGCSPPYAAC